ncbi:MAG: hypothetical protein ACRCTE_07440 [Cellulosilyticaceae bacterium]
MKKLLVVAMCALSLVGCGAKDNQKVEDVVVIPQGPVVVEDIQLSQEEAEEAAKDTIVRLLTAYENLDKQGIIDTDLRIVGATQEQFDTIMTEFSLINNYILHNVQVVEVLSNEIKGVFGYEYDLTEGEAVNHYQSVAYFSVVKEGEQYKLMGSEAFATDQGSIDAFFAAGKERWGADNLLTAQ